MEDAGYRRRDQSRRHSFTPRCTVAADEEMTTSRTATLDAHPSVVFEQVLDAAEELAAVVHLLDRRQRQAVFGEPTRSFRVSLSATDNGYGRTTLHASWSPSGSPAAARFSRRLLRATRQRLDGLQPGR
jgi:hypothetical protein